MANEAAEEAADAAEAVAKAEARGTEGDLSDDFLWGGKFMCILTSCCEDAATAVAAAARGAGGAT